MSQNPNDIVVQYVIDQNMSWRNGELRVAAGRLLNHDMNLIPPPTGWLNSSWEVIASKSIDERLKIAQAFLTVHIQNLDELEDSTEGI